MTDTQSKKQNSLILSSTPALNRRDFLRLSGGGLLLVISGGALTGCGGSGGGAAGPSGPPSPGPGAASSFIRVASLLSLPIDWTDGTAKSVVVTLMGALPAAVPAAAAAAKAAPKVSPKAAADVSDFVWTINRGADTVSTYRSLQPALNGTSILNLDFYDAADGGGSKIYHAALVADIDAAGNGLPQIKPGASPDLYTAPRALTVGTKADTPSLVTAHSGTGIAALAPGALSYTLLNGAGVVQLNPDGSLRGLKEGTATVSATAGGKQVAQTKVTASFTFDSITLMIDGDLGGYAPGLPTYYDVGQQKAVSATYMFAGPNAPVSWSFVWEGLDSTQVPNSIPVGAPLNNRTNFKFASDPASTALHPKATLTALRPGPLREASYWIRTSDTSRYSSDKIFIRVPSLGKYGKEGLAVSKDVPGTGLNYVDITQRDTAVSPDTGLNGAGVAYYTENGIARKADVTWITGWRGDASLINGINLGWGDVFFSGTDTAGGSGVTFQGKYAAPDTTDFTHAIGTVTIGKYVAAVTLVKDGGDLSGPGGAGPGGKSVVDLGQGSINAIATWITSEGAYLVGLLFGQGEQILIQMLSTTPGTHSLSADQSGYWSDYSATDLNVYTSSSGTVTILSSDPVSGNPVLIGSLNAVLKSDSGLTKQVTASFQATFSQITPSLKNRR